MRRNDKLFFRQIKDLRLTTGEKKDMRILLRSQLRDGTIFGALIPDEKDDVRSLLFRFAEKHPLHGLTEHAAAPSPLPLWLGTNLFGYLQPFRV